MSRATVLVFFSVFAIPALAYADTQPTFTSSSSAVFNIGEAESFTVTTLGDPTPTLSVTGGTVPGGLSFVDNGNGTAALSGTPAAGTDGDDTLTFTATNTAGTVTQSFLLAIQLATTITSPATATFTVGQAGSFDITTTGFPMAQLTFTGALPTGLAFTGDVASATLSGTPNSGTGGVYTITVTAGNGAAAVTQDLAVTVNEAPTITSPDSATFTVGQAGSFTITTDAFPVATLSDGSAQLPDGVTFVANAGVTATLSGTPTGAAGTYPFTISAMNSASQATQSFTLTIAPAPTTTSTSTGTTKSGGCNSAGDTGFAALLVLVCLLPVSRTRYMRGRTAGEPTHAAAPRGLSPLP